MTAVVAQEPREITIRAQLQYVSAVRRLTLDAARQAGLSTEEAGDLVLAVSEACNNAVQHGASGVASAEILVRAHTEPGAVHIEVHDPGTGFDPGDLWEPQSETTHGRGMLLMMQLTDRVEYTIDGSGTTVLLSKHSRTASSLPPLSGASGRDGQAPDAPNAPSPGNRRNNRLAYLFDVCRAVSGTLELPGVLTVLAERSAQLFAAGRARVLLYDPRKQTTTVAASWGEHLKVRPAESGRMTRQAVYVAGQTTTLGDLASHPEVGNGDAEKRARINRSAISVPIVSRGEVVGSIHLDQFQRPRRLSRPEVVALRAIAAQAAIALENARLYREVRRHVEELAALAEVARSVNASLDLDEILATILQKTRELLGVDVCAVMLLDGEGYLSVRASCGMTDEYVSHQRALLRESPLSRAISERRVIATWDLRTYDVPAGIHEGLVSAAAAPMLLNEEPVGTLNIYTRERCRFTEDQLRVLGALADHTALAVHNARLYESSQRVRVQLESSLERTGSALDAAKDLHEMMRLVAELAARALGADGGAIVLTDVGIVVGTGTPSGETDLSALQGLDALARIVTERGRPVSLHEVADQTAAELLRRTGIATCIAVPLSTRGTGGALCVYGRASCSFGTREIALLNSFAAQAAMAIENNRLLQDARHRLEELSTLMEVGQSVISKLDLETVLDRILEHVSRIMEAEVCSLLLVDPQSGELRVAACRGLDPRFADRLRISQGEGVIGAVLRDGEPRAVPDIRRHSDFVYQEVDQDQGLRALLCVPLRTPEEVLGVLNVYRTQAHAWSDAEVKFLSALGTQAAIAIQNATLYQQERQVAQALQKAFVPAHPPSLPGLETGWVYVPAGEQGDVGGDYYDFIPLERERLGFVIADVSGKGIRAATSTAMGKYLLRAYLVENPAPGDVVRRTNNALRRHLQEDMSFLTLFYGLWDPQTHHLTYVNAGHPYPLLWQAGTGRCLSLRTPHTMLLGVLPDQTFLEQRLIVRAGDVLLAYTDGVIEARRGMEQFGLARLEEALPTLVDQPAQAIADAIYARVCEFRDESPADDLTILVVKFGR